MRLVHCRLVTEDVREVADFYRRLVGQSVVLNDYYVEVPTGAATVAFSRCRFGELGRREHPDPVPTVGTGQGNVVMDFEVDDVDLEFTRIDALGVTWELLPSNQPWGGRTMVFRDPEDRTVNVFSRRDWGEW